MGIRGTTRGGTFYWRWLPSCRSPQSLQHSKRTNQAPTPRSRSKTSGRWTTVSFRGAQPKKTDYKDLAKLGIKTIIDLQETPEAYEKPMVESLGMTYVNIPMVGKKYPNGGSG
jgi:hypothetical protein